MSSRSQQAWNYYLSMMGILTAVSNFIFPLQRFLFLAGICCSGVVAAQENAPFEKGQMQWSAHLWWMDSDYHYDQTKEKVESIYKYGFYSGYLRARHGISDRLSAELVIPVINTAYTKLPLSGQRALNSGLGDIQAGIHYKMRDDSVFQLIGIGLIQFPTAEYKGDLSTGSQSFDQLLQLQAYSYLQIGITNAWMGASGGFNNRGHDYSNEFRYSLSAGWFMDENKVEASLTLRGIISTGSSEILIHRYPETLFGNQKEELIFSPSLQFKLGRNLAVGLGVDALLSGKNRAAGTGFQISVINKHL